MTPKQYLQIRSGQRLLREIPPFGVLVVFADRREPKTELLLAGGGWRGGSRRRHRPRAQLVRQRYRRIESLLVVRGDRFDRRLFPRLRAQLLAQLVAPVRPLVIQRLIRLSERVQHQLHLGHEGRSQVQVRTVGVFLIADLVVFVVLERRGRRNVIAFEERCRLQVLVGSVWRHHLSGN